MLISEMVVLAELVRPCQFLLLGGTLLVILGLAGVAGLLGSISQASLFNPPYWINWFHLTFGIVVFAIAFAGGRTLQSAMTLARGVWGARSAYQACCSDPTPRSVTTCRSLQIRPIISPI